MTTEIVLQTERLTLVKPSLALLQEVRSAVLESKAELETYLAWVEESLVSPEKNMSQAIQRHESFSGELRYYLQSHDSAEIIGAIGLIVRDIEVPFFEIGYWVRTRCAGQGYISEAIALIEEYAFEELGAKRLEIRMAKCNVKSKNVAERAGYTFDAELHYERRLPSGELTSTLVYSKCSE